MTPNTGNGTGLRSNGNGESRGREAGSPAEIPPQGWKDVLWRTYQQINEDRVTLIAAAVTYYALLALVPALSAVVSIYGLFTDPSTVQQHIAALASLVPQAGMEIINDQLTRLTSQGSGTLGLALVISLGLALWSASSGVKTLFEAMNIAYGEREKRNFFVLNGMALLFTLAGVVGALLLIGVAVVLPTVLGFVGLGTGFEWLIQIGSYVVLVLVMLTGIAALYRWGPSRQEARWRWITPGAVLAVVAVIIMSVLFSWYAGNFAHYDKTYGSLGGLIGLLTWMWLSVTALIVGAELNAEAERQTRKDSTVGADDPLGARKANAADTVGPAAGRGDPEADVARDSDQRSSDWHAGYTAATGERQPRRPSLGAMVFALPAALILDRMRRRG